MEDNDLSVHFNGSSHWHGAKQLSGKSDLLQKSNWSWWCGSVSGESGLRIPRQVDSSDYAKRQKVKHPYVVKDIKNEVDKICKKRLILKERTRKSDVNERNDKIGPTRDKYPIGIAERTIEILKGLPTRQIIDSWACRNVTQRTPGTDEIVSLVVV